MDEKKVIITSEKTKSEMDKLGKKMLQDVKKEDIGMYVLLRAVRNSKGKNFQESTYLRLCFLVAFFNIDICRCYENKYSHEYKFERQVDVYSTELGIALTEKVFFHDLPRSNKNSTLGEYATAFEEELVKDNLCESDKVITFAKESILSKGINNVISSYELFRLFLYEILMYVENDDVYGNDKVRKVEKSVNFILTNRVASVFPSVWFDSLKIGSERIYEEVSLSLQEICIRNFDMKYLQENSYNWNWFLSNWDCLRRIVNDSKLFSNFQYIIRLDRAKVTDMINTIWNINFSITTEELLNQTIQYAYLLNFNFKKNSRCKDDVYFKALKTIFNSDEDRFCALVCQANMTQISKIKFEHIKALYCLACLDKHISQTGEIK